MMEDPIKMDDLGVTIFLETLKYRIWQPASSTHLTHLSPPLQLFPQCPHNMLACFQQGAEGILVGDTANLTAEQEVAKHGLL